MCAKDFDAKSDNLSSFHLLSVHVCGKDFDAKSDNLSSFIFWVRTFTDVKNMIIKLWVFGSAGGGAGGGGDGGGGGGGHHRLRGFRRKKNSEILGF